MNGQFKFLFDYLRKENISIDKNEFLFQVQSHPDYPSLLSIVDTLSFFNIENNAFRLDESELELLPNRFITLLKEENGEPQLYFVEKKNDTAYKLNGSKSMVIDRLNLISKWIGIVLLTEKTEQEDLKSIKNKTNRILPVLCIILFTGTLFIFKANLFAKVFFIFPIIGVLFSIAAHKDLIGAKNELLNSFCNISATTSCSSVINSKKWRIFKLLDFSSISIIFFTSQLFSQLLFLIKGSENDFFQIQFFILSGSIPFILLSIYYQKFIEKKWCPICLAISLNMILELLIAALFKANYDVVSLNSLILFAFIFSTTSYCLLILKSILIKQKELSSHVLKGNRFIRDYSIFKGILTAPSKIEIPEFPMVLGNTDGKTKITIITNPFCGHCKNVHESLEKILKRYPEKLHVKVIFSPNLDFIDDDRKKVFRNLTAGYFEKGEAYFRRTIHNWFNLNDTNKWIKSYATDIENTNYDEMLKSQNKWTTANNFNFTPAIFINGYEYPKKYERKEIEFFIGALIEDSDFK